MDIYRLSRSFKLPDSQAKCIYCSTEYMCNKGPYSICPLCESIVQADGSAAIDPAAAAKLSEIKASISKSAFLEANENSEALSLNQDPRVLYTLSSFLKLLSDITYLDVDYTLKAFMERNADNRNDEIKRNKYSSMHLYSKYRECLHKCIEYIELSKQQDLQSIFINAMSEIKLKRYAHASIILGKKSEGLAMKYAMMVLSTETNDKQSEKRIAELIKANEYMSIFYAAKHLAMKKEFSRAASLIDLAASFIDMPRYRIYRQKITGIAEAAGI